MRATQSSAGVWDDAGGALVWGPLAAVLALGGPGSEVNMVKTESGHRVLPLLLRAAAAAAAAALGSRCLVSTTAPTRIGAGRRRAGPAGSGGRYCHGCRTNLTAGLGPDGVGGGGQLGRVGGRKVGQLGPHLQGEPAQEKTQQQL